MSNTQIQLTIKPGDGGSPHSVGFVGKGKLTATIFFEGNFYAGNTPDKAIGFFAIREAPGQPTVMRNVTVTGGDATIPRRSTGPEVKFTVNHPNRKAVGAPLNVKTGVPIVVEVTNEDFDGPCEVVFQYRAPQAAK